MKLEIFVVSNETAKMFNIKIGSAIVGITNQNGETKKVFFEGNIYGSDDLNSFESKCLHAAGRAVMNYPTIAKAIVPIEKLVLIGEYDYYSKNVIIFEDKHNEFCAWNAE